MFVNIFYKLYYYIVIKINWLCVEVDVIIKVYVFLL